jgi:hypothetical protein
MSEYGDAVAAALRADAEAARDEIREAGIACPSCGMNMADLPGDHRLVLDQNWAKCVGHTAVDLRAASFEVLQAAANINLMEAFRAAENKALAALLGPS